MDRVLTRFKQFCRKGSHCTCWWDGIWGECCKFHDLHYKDARIDRKSADEQMKRCICFTSPLMATIMYYGVRVGGRYFRKTKSVTHPGHKEAQD